MEKIPRIGIGVFIKRDGKILLGKRKNSHGDGTWSAPGGHLEFGETIFDCALRETKEETGLSIKSLQKGFFSEDVYEAEGKHYVTFIVTADWDGGEPGIHEPDRWTEWKWFDYDQLPEPLFLSTKNAYEQGFNPFKN